METALVSFGGGPTFAARGSYGDAFAALEETFSADDGLVDFILKYTKEAISAYLL